VIRSPRPAGGDAARARLRRRRLAMGRATLLVAVVLLGVGGLLSAPHDAAGIRVAGVALAWWATLTGFGVFLLALALQPRARS
jgi:protein-S-isoprenylcysteine O-methyltransferase Ste14